MHFGKKKTKKREAFYKTQEHGIQAKSKEQQFRSRIQSDIKIYKGDFLNTGDQKNQEENEKVR